MSIPSCFKIIFFKPGPPSGPVNGTLNHIYHRYLSHAPMTWNHRQVLRFPDKNAASAAWIPESPLLADHEGATLLPYSLRSTVFCLHALFVGG